MTAALPRKREPPLVSADDAGRRGDLQRRGRERWNRRGVRDPTPLRKAETEKPACAVTDVTVCASGAQGRRTGEVEKHPWNWRDAPGHGRHTQGN